MTDDPARMPDDPARATDDSVPPTAVPPSGRPLVERVGMGLIALAFAALFGGVAVAAWTGGEPFLGVMGGVGCVMTLWVGAITLFRG